MRTLIAVTGASGAIYAEELLRRCPGEKYAVFSKWGKALIAQELGKLSEELSPYVKKIYSDDDLAAPFASGSTSWDATVILPCTTSTVGKIASGIADSLITRAASVTLKERRRLIVCVRETPLSTIHLEQLWKLSQAGAVIMPVIGAPYLGEKMIDETAVHFADRVIQLIDPSYQPELAWKPNAL
jgi:4-hydroxy-3-polyprenylbenzoate decarboxylase